MGMLKFIIIGLFEWLWCLSNLIVKPRRLSYQKGFDREVRTGRIDPALYESWKKKAFTLRSDYGYPISCEFIYKGKKKIAILCHGIGCAKYTSIKYAEMFLRLGFSVLIYDHRNHGNSGRAHTSMGYYERYDLKKLVDWCCQKFGPDCKIVTHGESMGAATVLMHLGIDRRVSCAIADCGYSDLKQLLRHLLKQFYHLPSFLIPVESLLTYLRAGFWYREVSPIKAVSGSDIPVLFIHGKRDNMVPASMSRQMYDSKRKNKAIFLVAGARHAESICKDRKKYEQVVKGFLEKCLVTPSP